MTSTHARASTQTGVSGISAVNDARTTDNNKHLQPRTYSVRARAIAAGGSRPSVIVHPELQPPSGLHVAGAGQFAAVHTLVISATALPSALTATHVTFTPSNASHLPAVSVARSMLPVAFSGRTRMGPSPVLIDVSMTAHRHPG